MNLTKTLTSIKLWIGLSLVVTALQNCKPDPPDPPPIDLGFFSLGEAKDYVYFKKGTWWVYQNTRTGMFDTIIVLNDILDTIHQIGEKWMFTEEIFQINSISKTTGYNYNCFMRTQGATGSLFLPKPFCLPIIERYNPYEGEIQPFYYPFDKENYKYCLTVKDTMTINGKIYNKVAIFFIPSDGTEPLPLKHKPLKYYWAKNYGLVQKDLFNSKFYGDTSTLYHSWKIVASNILQ